MRLGAAVNESGPAPALLEHIQIAVGWERKRGDGTKIHSFYLRYMNLRLSLSHLPWTVNQQQLLVLLFPDKCKSQICDLKEILNSLSH